MSDHNNSRRGAANALLVLGLSAVVILALLGFVLVDMGGSSSKPGSGQDQLFLFCAAGIRPPVEQIVEDYQREHGVSVQLQYGGSNTLLSQLEVGQTGDLYIAADESYITRAQEKGLAVEALPLATQRPVIAVPPGNPKNIAGIDDLLREDVSVALANPDQAAVGKKTRDLLKSSGHWEDLQAHVTKKGVFNPTVPEVANAVQTGSVDAGIIWDSTAHRHGSLEVIRTPELDAGVSHVMIGVLTSTKDPAGALRLARYIGARDKGLVTFAEEGFEPADGDVWIEEPELTFFCGSVNRRAVEPIIKEFEQREGARVNCVYNGCGILTAQMQAIVDGQQSGGFPDTYMACDVYYLKSVEEMFQDAVNVSDTEVVIAVPKGNPKNVQSLEDLTKPGIKVSLGQPDQCTIGVLTRQLLESENVYEGVMANVVTQTPSSAMLVPTIVTGSVDATLAFKTDTLAEHDKLDVIVIDSPAAKAIQPFSIARSSDHKQLARRLYSAIASSRDKFETAGFHWRLGDSSEQATQ